MIHLIAKPSKKKKIKKLYARIQNRLDEAGVAYELHYTERKGDGARIASELTAEGEATLIVIGGDGSLNDVLTGIREPSLCKLGLIPAGTGNDFAAAANIPHGTDALELILKGETKFTDFISFEDGRRSMNIAGMGIDVDILIRCERMKHMHAKSKYFFSLIASLLKFKGYQVTVTVNGEEKKHLAMIAAVCNGKQLGGGIPLCPPAVIDDGRMDVVVVDLPKRSKLLGALIKLMKGKLLTLPFSHYYTCERATIVPEREDIAQYDGELYSTKGLAATLVTGQLRMFR